MLMEVLVAISSEVNILLGFHCSKWSGVISLQETPEYGCVDFKTVTRDVINMGR